MLPIISATSEDCWRFAMHFHIKCHVKSLALVPVTHRKIAHRCRVFHNLTDVGNLDGKRDFFLFESGIEPDWDHPGNEHGGIWLVHCGDALGADVASGAPAPNASLDSLWQNTVRALLTALRAAGTCPKKLMSCRSCSCHEPCTCMDGDIA